MPDAVWKLVPDEHGYPAAASYLALLAPPAVVADVVVGLRTAEPERWKAKDILRASGLPLLPSDTTHVAADFRRVKSGKPLSQVLLVRGELSAGLLLQVADGYHRVRASLYR